MCFFCFQQMYFTAFTTLVTSQAPGIDLVPGAHARVPYTEATSPIKASDDDWNVIQAVQLEDSSTVPKKWPEITPNLGTSKQPLSPYSNPSVNQGSTCYQSGLFVLGRMTSTSSANLDYQRGGVDSLDLKDEMHDAPDSVCLSAYPRAYPAPPPLFAILLWGGHLWNFDSVMDKNASLCKHWLF